MAYFSNEMPRPQPTMDDEDFWHGCTEQRLQFQCCSDCGVYRHPPSPLCPRCHSIRTELIEAPHEAEIFTFTVIHYAAHPAVAARLPYVAAVVTFPSMKGVRLVTNVTDIDPSKVRIGMKVTLWWDDIGDGMYLPRFAPVP